MATENQRLTPAGDCLTRNKPEIDILSRDSYQAFSIVDCLRSHEELETTTQMTSTFLALKTGQELEDSWPAHLIASKTTRHWSIPSVRFLRTRFFNYTEGTDHRNELHEMILKKDLLVNQIVLSPFSSLSWALID